jgi:uncharacterized protein (TIRG00374 family)
MDQKLLPKSALRKPFLWATASFISLVLLALVVMKADFSEMQAMLNDLSYTMLGWAVCFLFFEGVITSLRIWLFAGGKKCISPSFRTNAWYVLLLVILPARLGEVAAVVVFKKYLGQKYGAAAMSILTQRLYDVIILGVFGLIAVLGMGDFLNKQAFLIVGPVLITVAIVLLTQIDKFLTLAVLVLGKDKLHTGFRRKVGRLLLQARIYVRHILQPRDIPLALVFTILKWTFNLGALVFLFYALYLNLSLSQSVVTAAAYNFLAIIPIQTIGGIGVGEAGLALILAGMGITASLAAGASLLIRFVILLFPFVFWAIIMGGLSLKERIFK